MVEISREIDRKVTKPTSPYAPKQNQFQMVKIKPEKKQDNNSYILFPIQRIQRSTATFISANFTWFVDWTMQVSNVVFAVKKIRNVSKFYGMNFD